MNDIIYLTMRRLRTPLILLILVFFGSAVVLVSIPGVDEFGNRVRLTFMEACYFIAFTSTTIGFGEIPREFTGGQRLAVLILIFPNVIAWLYSIGVILTLVLDPQFKAVMARRSFQRRVRWIGEPFFVVCGFGNTGGLVARGLINRGLRPVVLEVDQDRLSHQALDDAFANVPMLACDTTHLENLKLAGIEDEFCRGVIAATSDDHANLTIAISSKLLVPGLPVLARSENQTVSDNMASFGTDCVINPYEIFAERMVLALTSPVKYLVQDWLISVPGSLRRKLIEPPTGRWIVCGAGRFGEPMLHWLGEQDLPLTVIDVVPERVEKFSDAVPGRGTEARTLEAARIEDAVGIIACTGDDIDNLSIVITARSLNEKLFIIARQEHRKHDALFDRCGADLLARRSLIVARRILAVATTPMLQAFLQQLVRDDDAFAQRVRARLDAILGERVPHLWVADLTPEASPGGAAAAAAGTDLALSDLTHNTRIEAEEQLPCVCLMVERGAQRTFLPSPDYALHPGDRLLFAGRSRARREMERALYDPMLLLDYATPESMPRSAIGRWWQRRRQPASGRM